jgi:hypothetical protein
MSLADLWFSSTQILIASAMTLRVGKVHDGVYRTGCEQIIVTGPFEEHAGFRFIGGGKDFAAHPGRHGVVVFTVDDEQRSFDQPDAID